MSDAENANVVVQQFEDALSDGSSRVSIESCLDQVAASERPSVLRRLIQVELDRQTDPDWDQLRAHYFDRFGDQVDVAKLIDQVRMRQPDQDTHTQDTNEERRPGQDPASNFYSLETIVLPHRPDRETPISVDIPDYEILGRLGRGGMGVVLRARQKSLDRDCAVKMILNIQLADAADVERFEREAKLAAGLNHPGIVQVFDYGDCDGTPYFSMEYVAGCDLKDYAKEVDLSPRDAAQLVKTISEAVDYAHGQGTLHRDLKPSNIMIDEAKRPKVTDFGLARRLDGDSQLTRTNAVAGTPSYMAPEQASGDTKNIDQRADIYALGAILYELLTGRPPFREDSLSGTLEKVRTTPPPEPRKINPNVDLDLNTICMKCLEKEPIRRYESAMALADDLQSYLEQRPIQARPVGLVGRIDRWRRRNPAMAIGLVAVFFLVVGGVGFGTHQGLRSQSDIAFQSALGELKNGNWQETLDLCDKALFYPADSVKIRLLKIRALDALSRAEDSRTELEKLEEDAIDGPYRAKILMLLGDSKLLDGDSDLAQKLLNDALAAQLDPADEAYVKGLLAKNSTDAVAHFTEATELDAYHHRAWVNYSLLMVMLGDHAKAKPTLTSMQLLYPDDPTFPVLLAMEETFLGDDAAAQSIIDSLHEKMEPGLLSRIEQLQQALRGLRDVPDNWDVGGDADPVATVIQLALDSGIATNRQVNTKGVQINLPFYIGQPLRQMQITFQNPQPGQPPADVAQVVQDTLTKMVHAHEEKLLTFVLASAHFAKGEFEEAERYYELALQRTSLIQNLDPEIYFVLAHTRFVLAALHGQPEKKPLGIENVRQRVKLKPLRPLQAKMLVQVLVSSKEGQLAEDVLRNCWTGNRDNQEIGKMLVQQSIANRNFGTARNLIQEYEQQWRDDPAVAEWKASIEMAQSGPTNEPAKDADEQ